VRIGPWSGGPRGAEDASYVTDGSTVAVRSPKGELLWLANETTVWCHTESGGQITEHDANAGFLLRERYGQAALAAFSIADLCDWLDARVVDKTLGEIEIVSETWGLIQVRLDESNRIEQIASNPGESLLRVTYGRYDATERDWFTTTDQTDPF
jgi:hypothetical protein